MSFAQPWFLLGLLGALIPIIIHLIHRRRPRKQPFPAIELVIQSVQRVERRWRLRRWLLLAARVLLVAALAAAAARPLWGPDGVAAIRSDGPQRLAVVIDATLSMRARYDTTTSFARAVVEARNLIDSMGSEDMAVLVAVGDPPQVLVDRPTPDRGLLLSRLAELKPSFGAGDVGEAITSAVQALGVVGSEAAAGETTAAAESSPAEGPDTAPFGARVVVLSDLAQSSFQGSADLRVPGTTVQASLRVIDVLKDVDAKARRNRAVTAAEAGHVPGRAPRTIEVRARVQSFERETASTDTEPVDINLRSAGRDLALGAVDIVPGTIVDKVLEHSFERAGVHPLVVEVEPDTLPEDDRRFVKVDVRRQVRVLVVDGAPSGVPKEDEVFYLERALLTGAADQPPPRIIGADDLPRADLTAFDVLILAGVDVFNRQEGARLTQFVERGGGLLITTSASMDGELYNAELGRLLPRRLRGLKQVAGSASGGTASVGLAAPDGGDPVTQLFIGESLGGLLSTRTTGYWLLQPATEPTMQVHLRYEDGQPALVSHSVGAGRTAVLTTSIDRGLTDLPIRPAFVPLIRQVVLHLGRALDVPDDRRTAVGQARRIRVPTGAQRVQVVAPDGREMSWQGSELATDQVTFEDTRVPGHYIVSAAFAGSLEPIPTEHFAVNVDTQESDLKPLTADEARAVLLGETTPTEAAPRLAASLGRQLDPESIAALLLMIMAAAFIAESALSAFR